MGSGTAYSSRIEITQQFLAHIGHGDLDQSARLLSPDATYRVMGSHPLAGVFSGKEAICQHLVQLYERTKGTFDTVKWEDWMLGENHVAALASIRVQSRGKIYKGRNLFVVRFNSEDKISEVNIFFEDAEAAERFFA